MVPVLGAIAGGWCLLIGLSTARDEEWPWIAIFLIIVVVLRSHLAAMVSVTSTVVRYGGFGWHRRTVPLDAIDEVVRTERETIYGARPGMALRLHDGQTVKLRGYGYTGLAAVTGRERFAGELIDRLRQAIDEVRAADDRTDPDRDVPPLP